MSNGREPVRTVRVPDDEWAWVKEAAAHQRENVSQVIRRAIADYVAKNHPDKDVRRRARR